ncbi:hypothetical protein [Antiquaquibacter soli]|uniref:Uncharacterized protein n=1 Tax=Antiquaquibacter soli TaxID=3064523 RepID=A0ABT9BLK0_9MICO|nr:hypothetical protein [Protaetiibacter sp. WY-16]MDO7880646.1 hypothetical protein [Protaetiibacter sp. WY-16]
MPSATLDRTPSGVADGRQRELVVAWGHPDTRAIAPVALLSFDGEKYSFAYLESAASVAGFKPLLGFPEFGVQYTSRALFPLFQQRVMDPKRPDFERYVSELGLSGETSPWEQIYRSGGSREGDTLQLFPVPEYADGAWTSRFLVHGMRHLLGKTVPIDGVPRGGYSVSELESLLGELVEGESLELVAEETNEYTDRALLVTTRGRYPLGYVPDFLLFGVKPAHSDGRVHVFVERVNPPEAGWHLRLLARMTIDAGPNTRFFEWQSRS